MPADIAHHWKIVDDIPHRGSFHQQDFGHELVREPLIKSSADCVAGKMQMDARRATKVVARTTKPRSATTQTPHFAATRRDGAFRAVCFVARLAKGSGHCLHLASRIPSRKTAVATAWDLIRGSLVLGISEPLAYTETNGAHREEERGDRAGIRRALVYNWLIF